VRAASGAREILRKRLLARTWAKPADSSVLEGIDSYSAQQYAFLRVVFLPPNAAKYNPEKGLESSVSDCALAI
jgi:hypothetical protein